MKKNNDNNNKVNRKIKQINKIKSFKKPYFRYLKNHFMGLECLAKI